MAEPDDIAALIDADGYLAVRVTPNARRAEIRIDESDPARPALRVKLTVPPEDGKANKALIKLLAKTLGCAPSSITLVRGDTAREKRLHIQI